MSPNRPFVSIAGFDPTAGAESWLISKHSNNIACMVLQSRLLILFKPKISFYPFNGLILLLYCVLSKNYSKLSHKSSENWYCSFISIFARNSVSTKRLSPKNKHCLGHRSKINLNTTFSISKTVLVKNIKKHRFNYAQLSRNHTIISSRN
jgi:hypothetical protein